VNPRALQPMHQAASPVGMVGFVPVAPATNDTDPAWRALPLDEGPPSVAVQDRFTEAFDRLLRSFARCPPGSALDSEEAAQEAWLVFLAHDPSGRAGRVSGDFPALLLTAIRHRLADLERYHRRRLTESLADAEADLLISRDSDPAVLHERGRIVALVRAVLEEARGRLPEPSYRIVVLRWIEGRTYAEVAEALAMPVERVRDRHRRVLSLLRELIIRRFGSDPTGLLASYLESDLIDLECEEVTP
jgi:RNA polymerase sigma factor (sigma-70 family)